MGWSHPDDPLTGRRAGPAYVSDLTVGAEFWEAAEMSSRDFKRRAT